MRINSLIISILFLLAGFAGNAAAQNVSFYAGRSKTWYDSRYYPALFGENVAPAFPTFDVKLGWTDYSSSPYASICKYPEVGVGFQLDCLESVKAANGPGMGNIYSLYGYIDRPLLVFRNFSLGYSGEFGAGFMFNNRYDPVTNPWNVVISTPVNAHISLGVQALFTVTPKYDAGIGFFFNHHSNGAVSFPNYGLNAFEIALRVGMKSPRSEEELHREPVDDGFKRRFQFGVQLSSGIMSNEANYWKNIEENDTWVNDRYFKYALELNALYRYCRTHASGLGFDLFLTPFCDKIAESDGRGETYDPVSYGFSLLHEMSYYNFSMMVGLGRYLYHNDGLARNKKLYQLVNLKYRFPQLGNIYTGIVLKAHKFKAAESIQISIGKQF
ncbi:MAG: acyloxyacyl hydrolase [Bacteroidales bacterium]|nr:acyloxyacyl hydrolase [Bacteroidales bacterium]